LDTLTHVVTGVCIAGSLPRTVRGQDASVIVVAASLLPDLDVLSSLSEPATAALNRHLLTHSLVGIALLSVGFGTLAWLLSRRLGWFVNVMLIGLGVTVHVALDLINAYGVALLYPWTEDRFELPLSFILNPVMTGILLAGAIAVFVARNPAWAARSSRAALLVASCYLVLCYGLRIEAERLMVAQTPPVPDKSTYILPELGSPLQWKAIQPEGSDYRQVVVYPLSGRLVDAGTVRSTPNAPLAAAARATETGRKIEAFFQTPVWLEHQDTVIAYDLRFRFASIGNEWDPFGFCFRRVGGRVVLAENGLGSYLTDWLKAVGRLLLMRPIEPNGPGCAGP
jgi:inner membrane protein